MGLFSNTVQGIEGAILLSIAHGIVSPALFILVTLLYERHGTRIIKYFQGLVTNMPIFTIFFFIFTLANCAVPLTANFIGEFLSLIGAFSMNPIITTLAGVSMILSAGYSFWLFGRVSFGQESPYLKNVHDLTRREFFVLLPLAFLTVLLGIFPNIILDTIHFSVSSLIIDTMPSSSYINSPLPSLNLLFSLFIPTLSLRKESSQKNSNKGFSIYCYENSNLIYTFISFNEATIHFQVSNRIILRYTKSNKLFQGKYILSLIPLDSNFFPEKMVNPQDNIFLYQYNPLTFIKTFSSATQAAKYFNVHHQIILKYA